MKNILYLIKVNDIYYGRENSINGRIINPMYIDKDMLYYVVKENAYKTKTAAIKGAEKIKKEKKYSNVSIQGLVFEN